jgi:hypothetical protein
MLRQSIQVTLATHVFRLTAARACTRLENRLVFDGYANSIVSVPMVRQSLQVILTTHIFRRACDRRPVGLMSREICLVKNC